MSVGKNGLNVCPPHPCRCRLVYHTIRQSRQVVTGKRHLHTGERSLPSPSPPSQRQACGGEKNQCAPPQARAEETDCRSSCPVSCLNQFSIGRSARIDWLVSGSSISASPIPIRVMYADHVNEAVHFPAGFSCLAWFSCTIMVVGNATVGSSFVRPLNSADMTLPEAFFFLFFFFFAQGTALNKGHHI
ncbi:hypothetical protein F4810DRAFT_606938 [Camillea tinctor]|nr:hypothetical protein F4810DRAFT_606938 [Camillea tinctor]